MIITNTNHKRAHRNNMIEEAIKLSFVFIEIVFDIFMLNYNKESNTYNLIDRTVHINQTYTDTCIKNNNNNDSFNSLILFDILFTNNPIFLYLNDQNFDFLKYFLNYKLFLLVAILIRWYLIYVNIFSKSRNRTIEKEYINNVTTIGEDKHLKLSSNKIILPVVIKSSNKKVHNSSYIIL